MITITAILQKARDLLKADTAISTWSTTKYGRVPTIYVAVDVKKMPKEDTMPHIILLPDDETKGTEQPDRIHPIMVAWCIKETGITSGTQTVEYDGVYDSDAFGQLIWECLSKLSWNCPASRCEYSVDGAAMVPLFPGYMTIEYREPFVAGATIAL